MDAQAQVEPHAVDEHHLDRSRAVKPRDPGCGLRKIEHHRRALAGHAQRRERLRVALGEPTRPLGADFARVRVGDAAVNGLGEGHVPRDEQSLDLREGARTFRRRELGRVTTPRSVIHRARSRRRRRRRGGNGRGLHGRRLHGLRRRDRHDRGDGRRLGGQREDLFDLHRRAIPGDAAIGRVDEQHHRPLPRRIRPERERRAVVGIEHLGRARNRADRAEGDDEATNADVPCAIELIRKRGVPVARRADTGWRAAATRERLFDRGFQVFAELSPRRGTERRDVHEQQGCGFGSASERGHARAGDEANLAARGVRGTGDQLGRHDPTSLPMTPRKGPLFG